MIVLLSTLVGGGGVVVAKVAVLLIVGQRQDPLSPQSRSLEQVRVELY